MRRLILALLLAGCAAPPPRAPAPLAHVPLPPEAPAPSSPPEEPPAAALVWVSPPPPADTPPLPPLLLTAADDQMISSNYRAAFRLYEEFIAQFPEHGEVPRAHAVRATLDRLFAAETAAVRLERDLAEREDEVSRLRKDLAAARLEAARLRADLERLKLIDLRLEREPLDGQGGATR